MNELHPFDLATIIVLVIVCLYITISSIIYFRTPKPEKLRKQEEDTKTKIAKELAKFDEPKEKKEIVIQFLKLDEELFTRKNERTLEYITERGRFSDHGYTVDMESNYDWITLNIRSDRYGWVMVTSSKLPHTYNYLSDKFRDRLQKLNDEHEEREVNELKSQLSGSAANVFPNNTPIVPVNDPNNGVTPEQQPSLLDTYLHEQHLKAMTEPQKKIKPKPIQKENITEKKKDGVRKLRL